MSDNYSAYTNLYHYMSSLLSGIQSKAGYSSQTYGTQKTEGKSFSETFQNTSRKLGVPESMDAIFEEAAQLYNVPLKLLMAVGKAESGFNPEAVSAAGAQGVMQLMPATAQALGVDDPFDARSNIMGGAKYIAEKLNQYDGDIELALAAYNAGSGNVSKYGGVPPFAETRNYIQRIKEYMGMDLTTGQTVTSDAGITGSTGEGIDVKELTELTSQYLLGKMHLKLQDQMNSLGLSLAGTDEKEDKEEEERWL